MAESLKGKVAVMTGVGSGFGKATAELFARADQVNLILIDRNTQALECTAENCRAYGSKVFTLPCDVTDPTTFERALEVALDNFGRVDFLINYAGGALKVAPIEEMDDEINRRIIDLNLTSTIMSCRTFTPQFKKQGFGKIINVSSACDRRSWPGWSVYSAAKAAVNSFTRCLYTELRPHGIAVMLLVPGGSNTGFQTAAENVGKFEWDEELAVRPEHFADMVYQACALTRGACVTELVLYGLAQDVSGY
ncbi:MAG TPA: SDR family oxidoreductase [Anaerolineales bacterium]|nr:SDR family oxidoreductase [Anaerolineales bacterium]